jgi:hypothetical protein
MSAPPACLSPPRHLLPRARRGPARTQIYSRHRPTDSNLHSLLGFAAARGPVSITELSKCSADCTTPTRNCGRFCRRASSTCCRRRPLPHELVATGRPGAVQARPAVSRRRAGSARGNGPLTADLHGALDRSMEKLAAL